MNFNEVMKKIDEALRFGIKPGLERIEALLECLGNPEKDFKSIHVAGTNGKGSTTALTAAVLEAAGYKVGVFTSPHLVRITERFKIDEQEISETDFILAGEKVLNAVEELKKAGGEIPTQFEVLTAMGFLYFSMKQVDFAVIEVGLGGSIDSTNVIIPELCFITSISFDHTDYLGNTIEEIAEKKAGIIKKNSNVAIYPQTFAGAETVLRKQVAKEGANAIFTSEKAGTPVSWDMKSQTFHFQDNGNTLENVKLGLIGDHQIKNAANVLNGLFLLGKKYEKIDERAIREGFEKVIWPCRLSVTEGNPTILADGAHNREGLQSLADALDKYFSGKKKVLLIGMLKDKEYRFAAELFANRFDSVVTTEADGDRKLKAEEFAEVFIELGMKKEQVFAESNWETAVARAKKLAGAEENSLICISGSLYITGFLLEMMTK